MAAAILLVLGTGALATAQDGDRDREEYREDDYDRDGEERYQEGNSSFEEDGDTLTGEHVALTVDEDRPGITGYRILDGDVTVFESVTLPGSPARWDTHDDRFFMETPEAHLMVRDHTSYRLGVQGDGAEVTLTVADGVEVSENESSSDGRALYEVVAGDHELKVGGDGVAYSNGTFRSQDDVMVGSDFPRRQGPPPEERRHEEPRHEERRPPAEHREESQWTQDGDDFQGEHVRFAKDEALPGVVDVGPTEPDLTVIAEIALPGDGAEWEAHGRMFGMRTSQAELRIVDVPPAVMNLDVEEGGSATITLAEGITAEEVPVEDEEAPENASMYMLHLPGNRTAFLGGSDAVYHEADPANGTQGQLVVDGMAIARMAPGDHPRPGGHEDEEEPRPDGRDERRGPPDDPGAATLDVEAKQQVDQAAATGKVGVEVHPENGDATAVEMGHVSATGTKGPDGEVKAGVTVEAEDDAPGTVVRFALDGDALEGVDVTEVPDVLTVRYDNETIDAADDLDDVLDWSDDGGEPEYLLLVGGEEVEVLVSVPHFSPHTIEVVETASSGSETVDGAPGPGVVAALVAGLGAAAIRRR